MQRTEGAEHSNRKRGRGIACVCVRERSRKMEEENMLSWSESKNKRPDPIRRRIVTPSDQKLSPQRQEHKMHQTSEKKLWIYTKLIMWTKSIKVRISEKCICTLFTLFSCIWYQHCQHSILLETFCTGASLALLVCSSSSLYMKSKSDKKP